MGSARSPRGSRGVRWMSVAVAAVVVGSAASCGSRVSDDRIRRAAGIAGIEVVSGPAASAAQGPGGGGAVPAPGGTGVPGQAPPAGTGAGQGTAPGAVPPRAGGTGGPGEAGGTGGPGAGGQASPTGALAPASPGQPSSKGPASGKAPASKSTVTVGVIATLSGPVGTVVGDGVKGIQVWAQYMNARGGVNGHPIKVIVGSSRRSGWLPAGTTRTSTPSGW
jgi:branched-chain amino acid transport system substrate-binding protein